MNIPTKRIAKGFTQQNTDGLCLAIEKIPTGPSFSAPKAFAIFIQHALCSIVEANKRVGEPGWMVQYQPRSLGFIPIEKSSTMAQFREVGEAVAHYLKAVIANEPFADLLTPVHAHFIGRGGEGLGQFFTPWDLAKLSSALAIDHQKRHGEPRWMRLNDPCCGAGGLLLAYIQDRILACGDDWSDRAASGLGLHVVANDIDPFCCAMSALQLAAAQLFHRLPLGQVDITVGDTLTQKTEPVFKSLARVLVPGGSQAFGTTASLAELTIGAFSSVRLIGQPSVYDGVDELILTNPPFGKAANSAWGRVMGQVLASEKARKESAV